MHKKNKPLPKPQGTPFGRQKHFEESEENVPLLADRMAAAMAEGRLEEFLKKEMPDNEHARALASMLLSMTGMMPSKGVSASPSESKEKTSGIQPSEDVINAARSGNIEGLMELLAGEHQKKTGAPAPESKDKTAAPVSEQPVIDKSIIDQLIKISSDNGVSLDWIILRALKLYAEGYQKTGRL